MTPADAWTRVLAEPHGLKLKVAIKERKLLVQQLYRYRTESDDERLREYVILQPENGEVWIMKKELGNAQIR